jgi:hypothetical protein
VTETSAAPSQTSAILQVLGMAVIRGAGFLSMKTAPGGASLTQVAWSREILGALTLGVVPPSGAAGGGCRGARW